MSQLQAFASFFEWSSRRLESDLETEYKLFPIVMSKWKFKWKQIAYEYSFQLRVHEEIDSMTKNEHENPDMDDTSH